MEMSPWITDFRCVFKKSVTVMKMLRTSRGPASSVCREFCVARARRIMLQAHRAATTCERGPKGPGCCCTKMRKRQKPDMWGVCHESCSLVHMFSGRWCLLMSLVLRGLPPAAFFQSFSIQFCSERLQSSAVSCAGLFFFCAQCLRRRVRRHDHLQAAWVCSVH